MNKTSNDSYPQGSYNLVVETDINLSFLSTHTIMNSVSGGQDSVP